MYHKFHSIKEETTHFVIPEISNKDHKNIDNGLRRLLVRSLKRFHNLQYLRKIRKDKI